MTICEESTETHPTGKKNKTNRKNKRNDNAQNFVYGVDFISCDSSSRPFSKNSLVTYEVTKKNNQKLLCKI